jgi:hypothetical protein
MGVTLDLRLIDHERIAVKGLRAVNDALRNNNPGILRDYLVSLPVAIDPSVVEYHAERLAKLRELKAPEVIIQNEERFLRLPNGEAYRPAEFRNATLDELRELLGTWCWVTHSYSLDQSWNELHWFLEPLAGPDDMPLHPIHLNVGDPGQTVFAKALQGAVPYPSDDLGSPVIRTCGSREPDCSGYNPPETARVILEALHSVDLSNWEEHVPFRCDLYRRANLGIGNEDIVNFVEDELSIARDTFPVLQSTYAKAIEKDYGVSCEYTL